MPAAHTPGPWHVTRLHHAAGEPWLQVSPEPYGCVARTSCATETMPGAVAEFKYLITDEDEQLANAYLMAAAPALLAACKAALENKSDTIRAISPRLAAELIEKSEICQQLRAAIALARGEA